MDSRLEPPPVAEVVSVDITISFEIPLEVLTMLGWIMLIERVVAWIQLVGYLGANRIFVVVDECDLDIVDVFFARS